MKINGKTNIFGFFGETFEKSLTYTMYNKAFEAMRLNCIYIPFRVKNLKKAVEGIRHLGIKGVGVTIPYKVSIIPFLDRLNDTAKKIGAVNVVINDKGTLIGGNTDGQGAVKALQEKTNIKDKIILLLGAGGAAKAIAWAIKEEGGKLKILNRRTRQAEKLATNINADFGSSSEIDQLLAKADILINATPVGMEPDVNHSLVNSQLLHPNLVVQELVINPKETKLIGDAQKAGCKIIWGKRTLLWQAILKFKLFTGLNAPFEVMEKALNEGMKG